MARRTQGRNDVSDRDARVLARNSTELTRRGLFGRSLASGLGVSLFGGPIAIAAARPSGGAADGYGPLGPTDANGLQLPAGFSSRIVGVTNQQVGSTGHVWHSRPDGGAAFAADGGGWVYVSNSEEDDGLGGVGVLRFDSDANLIDAYSILTGTSRNCAGGPTPWGTWLSCEENSIGEVWECDPLTPGSQGVVRPWMGKFRHEAAAVDPVHQHVYMTEDRGDGLLYRFIPSAYPDLSAGVLEAAEILDPMGQGAITPGEVRPLAWHAVPDPTVSQGTSTRLQVPDATSFDGGEGVWYESGEISFASKSDNRVWRVNTATNEISILYDLATTTMPELSGVDNLCVTECGDVFVAEDSGNMQIVALTPAGNVKPIMQLNGTADSEITGPCLSPDGQRLYFSSQRNPGVTYEVHGPFLGPRVAVPAMGSFGTALFAAMVAGAGAWTLRDRGATESGQSP